MSPHTSRTRAVSGSVQCEGRQSTAIVLQAVGLRVLACFLTLACRSLLTQYKMYEAMLPNIDQLVSSLRSALHVDEIHVRCSPLGNCVIWCSLCSAEYLASCAAAAATGESTRRRRRRGRQRAELAGRGVATSLQRTRTSAGERSLSVLSWCCSVFSSFSASSCACDSASLRFVHRNSGSYVCRLSAC